MGAIESWMTTLLIAFSGAMGTYAVFSFYFGRKSIEAIKRGRIL